LVTVAFVIFVFRPTLRMTDLRSIEAQLAQFRAGIKPHALARPATVADGIVRLTPAEAQAYEQRYVQSEVFTEKFVPASGAASRMFKSLLAWKNEGLTDSAVATFFQNKHQFPFGLAEMSNKEVVQELFENRKWDHYPKGLLPFHVYSDGVRSAAEEHLIEGERYLRGSGHMCHFTISPDHEEKFQSVLQSFIKRKSLNVQVSFSFQKPETDTIAVDMQNEPVRDASGRYVQRPAGHGALLENLNDRVTDLIFIKNIDSVVPERLLSETVRIKKVLAGYLLAIQEDVFDLLKRHHAGDAIIEAGKVLLAHLGYHAEGATEQTIVEKLNRPIRVCGMVLNQGEPGGGPFWVKSERGEETLQIVEGAQVDRANPSQLAIFQSSTHFNPVDLVCGVKDYQGKKFDLMKFRDPNTGFIAQKSYNGLPIKGLELPGLWNGSMADWNTVFVEVPLITFNPVKTVNDLLKPEHQPH